MNPMMSADPRAPTNPELSPEIMAMASRLVNQAKGRQIEPYLMNLRERGRYRHDRDKPALVEGAYRTYTLAKGTHQQVTEAEQKETDRINEAGVKAQGARYVPIQPRKTEFRPGDRVTPLTDNEALLLAQDPGKFRYLGPDARDSNGLDELQAEVERLRMESRQSAAMAEELAKLRAENDKLKKK